MAAPGAGVKTAAALRIVCRPTCGDARAAPKFEAELLRYGRECHVRLGVTTINQLDLGRLKPLDHGGPPA